MRGVRAAAAVAADEDESPFQIGVVNVVGEAFDLRQVERFKNFRAFAEIRSRGELRTQHKIRILSITYERKNKSLVLVFILSNAKPLGQIRSELIPDTENNRPAENE